MWAFCGLCLLCLQCLQILFLSPLSLSQIFSDEDDLIYSQVPSSSSSGSGDSEHSNSELDGKSSKPSKNSGSKKSDSKPHASSSAAVPASSSAPSQPSSGGGKPHPQHILPAHPSQNRMFNHNLPIVYAPHSSPGVFTQSINHFPCKYPGCTQVGGAGQVFFPLALLLTVLFVCLSGFHFNICSQWSHQSSWRKVWTLIFINLAVQILCRLLSESSFGGRLL